uniref:Membrane-associated protein n=1 Tax=Globodera pallida TaxID=36090 RepID=A0A183CDD2_GLOPA
MFRNKPPNACTLARKCQLLARKCHTALKSNLAFVLIGVVVVVVLLLVVALLAACFQRSKNDHNVRASATMSNRSQRRHKKQRNRSQQQSYIPGRKMSVSTPSAVAELDDDLWMIHQQPQQHNAGGGGRFATLINASAIEDFESAATVDDGTGILLIDGQQRAFIAPAGTAGLNLQSAAMECLTPAHYQQAFHAATTQRQETEHGQLEGGVVEVAFGGGSVPPTSLPHGMLESFHSMTNPPPRSNTYPKSGGSTAPSVEISTPPLSPTGLPDRMGKNAGRDENGAVLCLIRIFFCQTDRSGTDVVML